MQFKTNLKRISIIIKHRKSKNSSLSTFKMKAQTDRNTHTILH